MASLWAQAPLTGVPGGGLLTVPSGRHSHSLWTAQAAISLGPDWLLGPAKCPSWELPGSGF